jgi:hypothetical protein
MWAYLKRSHPKTWTDMGSPSFLNSSIKNNFLFLGFLFGRKYRILKDRKLNQLCLAISILFGVCMSLFVGVGWLDWSQP